MSIIKIILSLLLLLSFNRCFCYNNDDDDETGNEDDEGLNKDKYNKLSMGMIKIKINSK